MPCLITYLKEGEKEVRNEKHQIENMQKYIRKGNVKRSLETKL